MAQRTKILIVDNEPLNVTLFAAALFDSYEIISAFNGEQALQTVAEELPDLIILNILTQDIDGLEVTRRLRSNSDLCTHAANCGYDPPTCNTRFRS